jgi:glycosyltransferase involved in cell wall biosynthesis
MTRVAIIHDWLTGLRGGERCLEAFLRIYPHADIFTLVHVPGTTTPQIDARVRQVSFLRFIPAIAKVYRAFLWLYPAAVSSLRLDGYDLIISLSHAAAKNVTVPKGVPHICYCFTPMRYIWDQARSYFRGLAFYAAQPILQALRWWDVKGAGRVTHFVAISSFVSARIRKFYGRESVVIAPPVRMQADVELSLDAAQQSLFDGVDETFFLCAGALVPYKRIDVAIQAFNELKLPLWVVGGGPELERLRQLAGPTIRFLGRVDDAVLWECYRRCRALIFPGIEDFGIVPVECLSSGRPVIGIDAGGVGESVLGYRLWSGKSLVPQRASGVFIPKSACGDPVALAQAVKYFCEVESAFDPMVAKNRAAGFSYSTFFGAWAEFARNVGIDGGLSAELAGGVAQPTSHGPTEIKTGLC